LNFNRINGRTKSRANDAKIVAGGANDVNEEKMAVVMHDVDPPVEGVTYRAVSASAETVWVILSNNEVYIRQQMSPHCVEGYGWDRVDLAQLGKSYCLLPG